jgi:hypothetical protein
VPKKPGSTDIVSMPKRCDLLRERFHPYLERVLGRGVGRGEAATDEASGRRDGDDLTGPLLAQDGQDRPGDVEGAEEVGLHLGAHLIGAECLEEARVEVAGVVDEHVDAAEALDGGRGRGVGRGGVGDVEGEGEQVVVRADGVGGALRVAAGRHDGVARGECRSCDVDAHAAARAGDEADLGVSHGGCFPSRSAEPDRPAVPCRMRPVNVASPRRGSPRL